MMRQVWKSLYGGGLVILLSIAGPAFGAEPPEPSSEWYRCEADSDCLHIQHPCVDVAVNKAYAKPAIDFYESISARIECAGPPPRERGKGAPDKDGKDVPSRVYCEARQCKVRGKSLNKAGAD